MNKDKINRITVNGVNKSFNAAFRKNESTLSRIMNLMSGRTENKKLEVLKNVSFDVREGEVLGIIGKNGIGKSTLLRLVAGVYQPDSGEIITNGKVVYLTGLGQGASPKLTMRENIYLMGAVMGLSQKEIRDSFDEIVEFSGLEDFVDMKTYQFSTGMSARLNFSTVINCVRHQNPDILLLDEVLSAGGDIDFQSKANDKIRELIKNGAAVILVSHNLDLLEKYCDKIALIYKGEMIKYDNKEEAIRIYKAQ